MLVFSQPVFAQDEVEVIELGRGIGDTYRIMSGPNDRGSGQVMYGYEEFYIIDQIMGSDGNIWYEILTFDGKEAGWLQQQYVDLAEAVTDSYRLYVGIDNNHRDECYFSPAIPQAPARGIFGPRSLPQLVFQDINLESQYFRLYFNAFEVSDFEVSSSATIELGEGLVFGNSIPWGRPVWSDAEEWLLTGWCEDLLVEAIREPL